MKTQKPATKTATVILKKMPKANELAPQAFAILETLKSAKGRMELAALKAEMPKRVKTKQSVSRIWLYYRDSLVKSGFVTVKGGK
jgi:hypothetical protein